MKVWYIDAVKNMQGMKVAQWKTICPKYNFDIFDCLYCNTVAEKKNKNHMHTFHGVPSLTKKLTDV